MILQAWFITQLPTPEIEFIYKLYLVVIIISAWQPLKGRGLLRDQFHVTLPPVQGPLLFCLSLFPPRHKFSHLTLCQLRVKLHLCILRKMKKKLRGKT